MPIDYSQLDTHTLAQLVIEGQERIEHRLTDLCVEVNKDHDRLVALEADHKVRTEQGSNCAPPISRRQLAYSAAGGGGIVGAIIIVAELVLKALV